MKTKKNIIIVILLFLIFLFLFLVSGCEELIQEIVASARVKAEAETAGKVTFCPKERAYRVGGLTGVCVDEDGLSEFTGLKLHGTADEQKEFVKTTKALQKGTDKECPKDTPYYVSGFLSGGKCVSKSDFKEYLADGKIEDDNADEVNEKKSCEYEKDCSPICEGAIAWKQGCNPRTKKCENTFDTDCSELKDIFGDYEFKKTCIDGSCVSDDVAIQAQKQELIRLRTEKSNEVKSLNAKKQTAQQIMMDANKNCINGLAEVTNKLIIDTGLSLASPAKKLADVASDITNNLLDGIVKDSKQISAHEFITTNCRLFESLKKDIIIIEKKSDKIQKEAKEINEKIKKFE